MDAFFEIIITLVPLYLFYNLISWELKYYRVRAAQIRYRSRSDPLRIRMYLKMLVVAVAVILMALPFIVLVMFRPL